MVTARHLLHMAAALLVHLISAPTSAQQNGLSLQWAHGFGQGDQALSLGYDRALTDKLVLGVSLGNVRHGADNNLYGAARLGWRLAPWGAAPPLRPSLGLELASGTAVWSDMRQWGVYGGLACELAPPWSLNAELLLGSALYRRHRFPNAPESSQREHVRQLRLGARYAF
jgi:hypothetical protein